MPVASKKAIPHQESISKQPCKQGRTRVWLLCLSRESEKTLGVWMNLTFGRNQFLRKTSYFLTTNYAKTGVNSKFTTDDGVHVFCLIEELLFPCLPNWSLVGALAQDGHLPGYNCTYRSYRGEQKRLPVYCRPFLGAPCSSTYNYIGGDSTAHLALNMIQWHSSLSADVETNLRIKQISTNVCFYVFFFTCLDVFAGCLAQSRIDIFTIRNINKNWKRISGHNLYWGI